MGGADKRLRALTAIMGCTPPLWMSRKETNTALRSSGGIINTCTLINFAYPLWLDCRAHWRMGGGAIIRETASMTQCYGSNSKVETVYCVMSVLTINEGKPVNSEKY